MSIIILFYFTFLLKFINIVHSLTLTSSQLATWYPNYLNETSFYLGSKNIQALDDGVFTKLFRLQVLDLNGNRLVSLTNKTSPYFKDLFNLEYLYLEYNELKFLDEATFFGLTKLCHLYLHNNRLVHLNEFVFRGLISLEYLWLDGNEILELSSSVFYGLDNLIWLELSQNNLTFIQ